MRHFEQKWIQGVRNGADQQKREQFLQTEASLSSCFLQTVSQLQAANTPWCLMISQVFGLPIIISLGAEMCPISVFFLVQLIEFKKNLRPDSPLQSELEKMQPCYLFLYKESAQISHLQSDRWVGCHGNYGTTLCRMFKAAFKRI